MLFEPDELFPRLRTLLGLPDCIASELLRIVGTAKKRKTGHAANADARSAFKSRNHFTNANAEIASHEIGDESARLMKIAHATKGPAASHREHESFSLHESPAIIGQCRKTIKLVSRELGDIANSMLLEETAIEFRRKAPQQRTARNRRNLVTIDKDGADEEEPDAIPVLLSVLGMLKIDEGEVPERSFDLRMSHFKMTIDNDNAIDKSLVGQ